MKYIEVKTTRGNINTDFYMSPREIAFSQINEKNYYSNFLHVFRQFKFTTMG